MNHFSFPPHFQAPNPIFDDGTIGPSTYISNREGLEWAGSRVEPLYRDFFDNIEQRISDLADSAQLPSFAEWLRSLQHKTTLLEIHNNAFFNQNKRMYSDFYIQFSDCRDYNEWKGDYPSYGISVELVDRDLSALPGSLQEVNRLGAIWLFGIPCSGFFYHPDAIRPALEEEYLGEYISDDWFKRLGFPLNELMVFYTDSGCWLMYDKEENVYCGGVECGDFYKSSMKLSESIDTIFSKLLTGDERMGIEGFAPKEQA